MQKSNYATILYAAVYWQFIWFTVDWNHINQSNFYSANISGEARLSGATAKSLFNSKIEETTP